MQERHVNINRNFIRLKIKQLLKKHVAENNPHIIEFILNKVMNDTVSLEQFLGASVGILTEEFIPVGNVVQIKLERVKNWTNKSQIEKMLEDPGRYGIDAENETITAIISEQYWYGGLYKYSVAYRLLKDVSRDIVVEDYIDVREDDIIK